MAVRPKNLQLKVENGCKVIVRLLITKAWRYECSLLWKWVHRLVLSFYLLFISMHFESPLEVIRRDRLVCESEAPEWPQD